MDAATKFLRIPEFVRGMKELDKTLFRASVVFPVIEVNSKDLSEIRAKVRIEKYLLKNLHGIRNVSDSDSAQKKLLVFDPDLIKEESKTEILDKLGHVVGSGLSWTSKKVDVGYDNWDMKRIIRSILPDNLDFSGFTQTGHIIHCNFRDELEPYKKVIGQVLLDKVQQCKTVINKLDGITNEFRNFEIELVAGDPNFITIVTEGGLKYKMDFSKVFWNSRLSHEHERVFKSFNSHSLVYDACAGVGPFALPAMKKMNARRVFANDLNPESVRWLKENVQLNKMQEDRISVFNCDATEFIRGPVATDLAKEITTSATDPEWIPCTGAHIMMNLPAYSPNFLPAFRGMLAEKVPEESLPECSPFPITVYCYLFAKAHEEVPDDWFAKRAAEMVREKLECDSAEISLIHHVRTVSSRKEMFCVQIQLPLDFLISDSSEPLKKKARTD